MGVTRIYPDATTLIALGGVGELELLTGFDGRLVFLESVVNEVTTEPAAASLDRFCERADTVTTTPPDAAVDRAREILDTSDTTGDVCLIAAVLNEPSETAIISDDRRVRTVAEGLGARVTGTVGVVVRAVHDGLARDAAVSLLDRLDDRGLHMTAELRAEADELIDEAAADTDADG